MASDLLRHPQACMVKDAWKHESGSAEEPSGLGAFATSVVAPPCKADQVHAQTSTLAGYVHGPQMRTFACRAAACLVNNACSHNAGREYIEFVWHEEPQRLHADQLSSAKLHVAQTVAWYGNRRIL